MSIKLDRSTNSRYSICIEYVTKSNFLFLVCIINVSNYFI